MPTAPDSPCVLIVASSRDERRTLFDTLETQGYEKILSARDVAHARLMLEPRPPLDLVIMEFDGEAREAVIFCAQLHGVPEYAGTPMLGILAAEPDRRTWGYRRAPPGVIDWLHCPVDAEEVRMRVRSALSSDREQNSRLATDNYRFAFEDSDAEWIVSDPVDGRILEVNNAFVKNSGIESTQASKTSVLEVLGENRQQMARQKVSLERDGYVVRQCNRQRADGGTDAVQAVTRVAVRDGKLVHVSHLHSRRDMQRARDLLAILAQLNRVGDGDDGVAEATDMLVDALQLDFAAIYVNVGDGSGAPLLLAQKIGPSITGEVRDATQQPALRLVLEGDSLMHADDAARLARSDSFVAGMGFAAFAGLPLIDARGNVLGALLVGQRQPWPDDSLIPEALRAAASRFVFELELRRTRQQGRAKGLLDGLTGLPNRLLFNDRLDTTLREARRTGEMFAVLFVDLDRFKSINDSLGHSVGDEVLLAVARRLRGCVRSSDTVARYAGDEFTLILRHITHRDDVLRIADKIVRLMNAPLTLADGSELHLTASMGISFHPDDASTVELLLKHADVAMYNAKGLGRNGYQVYVAVPEKSHQQRIALESKLRQAEKNGELRVHYQPQVNAETEDIVGMEALVRWEHPELGMISPGFFIPLAEETGLIISLGEWVLRTACADARRWQQRYKLSLRIGVNLSALQLMQPNLTDVVASALRDSGLDPRTLELEVTESISVKSVPHLLANLRALHELGCGVAIDDFGTGQASLDYLRNLPAQRIKIDQSFVRNIGIDPDDEAIIKATIEMAHNLNRCVVAEGVEIEAHMKFLRAHGCEELQGYLFCRPLPPAAFDILLADRQRLFARRGETAVSASVEDAH